MSFNLFYSWQADLPSDANKDFIKTCLKQALNRVEREHELDERPSLDHDTLGVPGSPEIINTILSKIDKASIFVADLSFIAKTGNGKFCPNPNVLIELGYALKSLGSERLIFVVNEHWGVVENNLPFDLRHRRFPIKYNLAPKARLDAHNREHEKLVKEFVYRIGNVISSQGVTTPRTRPETFKQDQALFSKLINDFPSNGKLARFLDKESVGNLFLLWYVDEAERFVYNWSNAMHKFFDPTLEKQRQKLIELLTQFVDRIPNHVWLTPSGRYYDMGLEEPNISDGELERRLKARDEINEICKQAYKEHQELIYNCRKTLGSVEEA
ncbi:hypothetical protein [Trichocoleus sp. FACHB-262]|uniref:hypothetical protein n=1 Tax=Trichocoleus sp. FACHB-262 TaxID=2692869 RepID=UPI0016888915|nr:hypothetical protein [Trichocoleus sp. FACHB-262]MBD2119315.1 hypothetical protein [Trichocoleus sp. FACHB-262]